MANFFCLISSLRKKYGYVYSMKVGSFKLFMAEDADSVKEVLVTKSADYAGRPPFHSFQLASLGTVSLHTFFFLVPSSSLREWSQSLNTLYCI